MIPVQYRDSQTEEVLELRYEESAPSIGERVRVGFEEFQVLYRWRCVPTSCIVYVGGLRPRFVSAQQPSSRGLRASDAAAC